MPSAATDAMLRIVYERGFLQRGLRQFLSLQDFQALLTVHRECVHRIATGLGAAETFHCPVIVVPDVFVA